jgi:hypothetical protein
VTAPGVGVLVVASSATEGRALAPVATELAARGMSVSLLDTGPLGVGNAAEALPGHLARERLGLTSRLAPQSILERHRARVVVLGNDNLYLNRQLVRTARSRGVKTVLVQEGAILSAQLETIVRGPLSVLLGLRRTTFHLRLHATTGDLRGLVRRTVAMSLRKPVRMPGYGFAGADVFCVANEQVAHAFKELGCGSRTMVTGIPCAVAEPRTSNSAEAPYDVVYIAAPLSGAGVMSEALYRDYLRRAFRALRDALPEAKLAVKVHPSWERVSTYDWLVASCPGLAVVAEPDRTASVELGRAYLSFGSTLMLDVWMANRVGLCLADAEVPESLQTTDVYRLARAHGAIVGLLSDAPGDVRRKLTEIDGHLFDAVRREYGLSVGDGAAGRIADVVEDLVREGPAESVRPT